MAVEIFTGISKRAGNLKLQTSNHKLLLFSVQASILSLQKLLKRYFFLLYKPFLW